MDITDAAAVGKVIGEINDKAPLDGIIHCAAWTAVDKAEDFPEKVRSHQCGRNAEHCGNGKETELQDDVYQHGLCLRR
jgi:dTDP-4-dehydrorhamnose reductase